MANDIKDRIVAFLPRLRRFAFTLTGCPDRAEDLLQDTCVKAIARSDQWQDGTRLDSWLFRIAQNHWIDTVRAAEPLKGAVALDDLSLPDNRTIHSAGARHHHYALRAAVGALPPEQRTVIALVCVEGFSYSEAAEILELPVGTVMSRLSRGRKALHSRLYGDDDSTQEEVPAHA